MHFSGYITEPEQARIRCIASATQPCSEYESSRAVMAVFIKTKNKSMKSIALSSGISAFLGITEPAIYGVTLRLKNRFMLLLSEEQLVVDLLQP